MSANSEQGSAPGEAPRLARPPDTLAADLLREVVRTPAARELAARLLGPPSAEGGAALTRALLWEDPALGLDALAASPHLLNGALGALQALGQVLRNLPPPLAADALDRLVHEIDQQALHEARATWSALASQLWDDPQTRGRFVRLLARAANAMLRRVQQLGREEDGTLEPVAELALQLCGSIDFGLVREAAEGAGAAVQRALPRVVDRAISDPVLLSNLVGVFPPLANAALCLAARTVGAVRLPPEVLASGLFNLLEALDTAAMADLLDEVGRLLAQAHEGNLVLGRHEPRLREVLGRVAGDLWSKLDRPTAAAAAVALAEDLETLLRVAADLLYANPDLLQLTLACTLFALQASARGLGAALEKLGQLPDDAIELLAAELEQGAPLGRSLAGLANHAARLALRVLARRPHLAPAAVRAFRDEIDRQTLWQISREVAGPLWAGARQELARIDPARAGQLAGQALARICGALVQRPRSVHAAVQELDSPAARAALEATLRELGLALTRHPGLLRALADPVIAGVQRLLLDYVRTLPRRLASCGSRG